MIGSTTKTVRVTRTSTRSRRASHNLMLFKEAPCVFYYAARNSVTTKSVGVLGRIIESREEELRAEDFPNVQCAL
jgi:hypothetical protein